MKEHVFTPFSGIGFVMLLTLIPWHIRARNVSVLLLSAWLGASVLCLFIGSILWWSSYDIKAIPWCEISTRISYSAQIAPACCCLCVLRRLEAIASTRVAHRTAQDKKRQLAFDLCVGLLIPVLFIALQIVNQGHRMDIMENFGCAATFYLTPVAVVLVMIPPVIVSTISLIYGTLALRWFLIRRHQLDSVLKASGSQMDRKRYTRLMAMACTEAFVTFPINIYMFVTRLQYSDGVHKWVSWSDTHYDFNRFDQYPIEVWDVDATSRKTWASIEVGRWGVVVGCWLVFFFFAPSPESVAAWSQILSPVVKMLPKWSRKQTNISAEQPSVMIQTVWQLDHGGSQKCAPRTDVRFGDSASTISAKEIA